MLVWKLFLSPSILNKILAGDCNLGCRFFPFQYFKYILPFPSGLQSFCWRSAVKDMGFPWYVTCCFPLLLLIFFLCAKSLLVWLVCVLVCFSLGLSCMGLFVSLELDYFFLHVGEIFNCSLFKNFLYPFFFSSSSGIPIIWMLVHLILSQRSLKLSSVLFILFTLFFVLYFIH